MKKQVLEFPVGTYKGEVKNNLPHGKGKLFEEKNIFK